MFPIFIAIGTVAFCIYTVLDSRKGTKATLRGRGLQRRTESVSSRHEEDERRPRRSRLDPPRGAC
jgi:hypothetical protein